MPTRRLSPVLLASEHYGERMASTWLDVARYSDSFGYQVDRDRRVWPWRDWVIRAYNAEHAVRSVHHASKLAGDLLPEPTRTTSGFAPRGSTGNHGFTKVEGGSDATEEYRNRRTSTDRTTTVRHGVFMGLTLECSRCHDHKYDPLLQKEFYGLTAFFDNIDEAGLYSFFTNSVPTPTLRLADEPTKRALGDVEERIAEAERGLAELRVERHDAFAEWLACGRSRTEPILPGKIAHLDFEGPPKGRNRAVDGPFGSAVELSGDDGIHTGVGNFTRNAPFSVALWVNTPDTKERAVVFHRSRAWTDAASRGYQLLIESGRLSASLIHFWPGNAIRIHAQRELIPGRWHHVAMTWDGSSRADGLRIWIDGALAATDVVRDKLDKNITGGGGDQITIGERFRDKGFTGGRVDEFTVFDRELTGDRSRTTPRRQEPPARPRRRPALARRGATRRAQRVLHAHGLTRRTSVSSTCFGVCDSSGANSATAFPRSWSCASSTNDDRHSYSPAAPTTCRPRPSHPRRQPYCRHSTKTSPETGWD